MEKDKPVAPLIGANGNIFNLLAIAKRTLQKNNLDTEADEMQARVFKCSSYSEALAVIGEYVVFGQMEQ